MHLAYIDSNVFSIERVFCNLTCMFCKSCLASPYLFYHWGNITYWIQCSSLLHWKKYIINMVHVTWIVRLTGPGSLVKREVSSSLISWLGKKYAGTADPYLKPSLKFVSNLFSKIGEDSKQRQQRKVPKNKPK